MKNIIESHIQLLTFQTILFISTIELLNFNFTVSSWDLILLKRID